jgi:hypothetical protein
LQPDLDGQLRRAAKQAGEPARKASAQQQR